MSRFLSKSEILFWEEKIKDSSYSNSSVSGQLYNIDNPSSLKINYRFSFSIARNHESRFEILLNNFLEEGFTVKYSNQNCSKRSEMNLRKEISTLKQLQEKYTHQIKKVDYINYKYNFNYVPVLPCIYFVQTIKDIIEIISNYWAFDEEGNEICNMQYSTGQIVSLDWDKSDYMIDSILYLRKNTDQFESLEKRYKIEDELLLYRLSKIISFNQQVIEFGNQELASSSQITPSRGERLDELLG
jgi:hypothetical protein